MGEYFGFGCFYGEIAGSVTGEQRRARKQAVTPCMGPLAYARGAVRRHEPGPISIRAEQLFNVAKRLKRGHSRVRRNSPRNDENTRDKMASCPTYSEGSFTSSPKLALKR